MLCQRQCALLLAEQTSCSWTGCLFRSLPCCVCTGSNLEHACLFQNFVFAQKPIDGKKMNHAMSTDTFFQNPSILFAHDENNHCHCPKFKMYFALELCQYLAEEQHFFLKQACHCCSCPQQLLQPLKCLVFALALPSCPSIPLLQPTCVLPQEHSHCFCIQNLLLPGITFWNSIWK